jgi:RimJ/RimL family protein N-acetyltransferase
MAILETDRLILRPLTLGDADDLHAALGDPEAMTFYPKPYDRAGTEEWILKNVENHARLGYGFCAVVLRKTGACIGDCGLSLQIIDNQPELEIGYHLQRRHWKRGYATEAARAVRDHVFDTLRRNRVVSWMRKEHLDSRRVAERVGMRLEKESTHRLGLLMVVYSMSRAEYEAAKRVR